MESLEQFIAKQEAELEKKKQELQEFAKLGPIPGLDPYLIHTKLYGYRLIGFKLADLDAFLEWAKATCLPVYAIEGTYKTLRPEIPQTRDYEGSSIKAEGNVVVTYSTIMRRFKVKVFVPDYEITFEIERYVGELTPKAEFRNYSDRYNGERRIDNWFKTGRGVKQYLRVGVDRQSADLETLLTWPEFEGYFAAKKVEA
jgi:hypothetical protein